MGSTGSGTFSDYGHKPKENANQGASSGEDKCARAFSTFLEEIQNCEYFKATTNVPPVGTAVSITFHNPRLAVQDDKNVIIGYLPTKFNYLLACIESGINYSGIVSNSTLTPLASVMVDISPI
ncbi:hypothetical protein [Flavobacterium sp.]|uniref:hypothetical protein n=1 Tax=Flavobacterium sp. TaxID=239 RepID=UPI0038FC474E